MPLRYRSPFVRLRHILFPSRRAGSHTLPPPLSPLKPLRECERNSKSMQRTLFRLPSAKKRRIACICQKKVLTLQKKADTTMSTHSPIDRCADPTDRSLSISRKNVSLTRRSVSLDHRSASTSQRSASPDQRSASASHRSASLGDRSASAGHRSASTDDRSASVGHRSASTNYRAASSILVTSSSTCIYAFSSRWKTARLAGEMEIDIYK